MRTDALRYVSTVVGTAERPHSKSGRSRAFTAAAAGLAPLWRRTAAAVRRALARACDCAGKPTEASEAAGTLARAVQCAAQRQSMQRRRRPGPARHGPAGMARAGHGMATAAHDNIAPVTHAAIHRRPSPKATLRCALRLQARQRMAARRCYIATAMPCKTRARRRTALRCGTGPLRAGCRRTGGKGVLEYSRRAEGLPAGRDRTEP